MTETGRIADQLERALDGDAWHGAPLLAMLRPIDAAGAARRPIAGAHTTWELVEHIRLWLDTARRRLGGEAVDWVAGEDWPPMPGAATPEAWASAVHALERSARDLVAAVRALDDAALARPVAGQSYDAYVLLHGVVQHSLYHAGQIAIVQRAIRGPERTA
jgi:hypothetical protein